MRLDAEGVQDGHMVIAREDELASVLLDRSLPGEPRLRPFLRHLPPVFLDPLYDLPEPMPDVRREGVGADVVPDGSDARVIPRLMQSPTESPGARTLIGIPALTERTTEKVFQGVATYPTLVPRSVGSLPDDSLRVGRETLEERGVLFVV